MPEDLNSFLPLSPASFYILFSLAAEDRHGYGIMQEVTRHSSSQYKLGPGTLYDNLQKLMTYAMVENAPRRSADDDPRRRYYRLTAFGRRILAAEVARLEDLVREAKSHLRAPDPRRAT